MKPVNIMTYRFLVIFLLFTKNNFLGARIITLKNLDFISNGNPSRLNVDKNKNEKLDGVREEDLSRTDTERNKQTTSYDSSFKKNKTVHDTSQTEDKINNIIVRNDIISNGISKTNEIKGIKDFKRYVPISEDIEAHIPVPQEPRQKIYKDGLSMILYL